MATSSTFGMKDVEKRLSDLGKDLFRKAANEGDSSSAAATASSSLGADKEGPLPFFLDPTAPVPPLFKVLKNKGFLTGEILLRVTSKMVFRKWKAVFFVLSPKSLEFFASQMAWELNHDPIKVYELHPALTLTTLFKQTSGSLADTDVGVYSVRLVEMLGIEDSQATSGMSIQSDSEFGVPGSRLNPDEFKSVVKFGSKSSGDVTFLSNAIKCVIQKRDGAELAAAQKAEKEREAKRKQSLILNATATSAASASAASSPPSDIPKPLARTSSKTTKGSEVGSKVSKKMSMDGFPIDD